MIRFCINFPLNHLKMISGLNQWDTSQGTYVAMEHAAHTKGWMSIARSMRCQMSIVDSFSANLMIPNVSAVSKCVLNSDLNPTWRDGSQICTANQQMECESDGLKLRQRDFKHAKCQRPATAWPRSTTAWTRARWTWCSSRTTDPILKKSWSPKDGAAIFWRTSKLALFLTSHNLLRNAWYVKMRRIFRPFDSEPCHMKSSKCGFYWSGQAWVGQATTFFCEREGECDTQIEKTICWLQACPCSAVPKCYFRVGDCAIQSYDSRCLQCFVCHFRQNSFL